MEDITTSRRTSMGVPIPPSSNISWAISGSSISPFFTRTRSQNLATIVDYLDEEKVKAKPKEILKIPNAELKAAIISKFGIKTFLQGLKRTVLDETNSTYTLKSGFTTVVVEEVFEVDLDDDFGMYNRAIPARFVKVFDPSKEEFVFLRVNPKLDTDTVMGARASTFELKEQDFKLLKET